MALGLVSADDGRGGHLIPFFGSGLRVLAAAAESEAGITGWTLAGSAELDDDHRVDGLSTSVVDGVGPVFADHPLGAVGLDHVVVSTDDLERTTGAITAATGAPLKRIRELGSIRQGFHRVGPAGLIVEVVEHADSPPGPASFWGVVINVDDLDAACELIGPDLIGQPKDAVQPGRRIATIRRDAGLGTAVALMPPCGAVSGSGTGHQGRRQTPRRAVSSWSRNQSYVDLMPASSSIDGCHPSPLSFDTSSTLRGMPSGLE